MARSVERTPASPGLRALASWALALAAETLAPLTCAGCEAGLTVRAVLCAACARGVVRAGPSRLSSPPIVAFGFYGGPLADALRRFKYGHRPDLAAPLGQLLRRAARDARIQAEVIVPVPLHGARLVERGYNQAALLARELRGELGAPLAARAIVRVKATSPQARLPRDERLVNLAGAIEPWRSALVRGKRVVLVDDVTTTGATLRACAVALEEAGAASVTGLVVARADERAELETVL